MSYSQPIINPHNPGGPKTTATIPDDLVLHCYKFQPTQFANFVAAQHVLTHPLRIFGGIRDLTDGYWCFTGRPAFWYVQETVSVKFPDNLVFAVYLNSRLYVYEFRAERLDPLDPDSPQDWQHRYTSLIWTHTS